MLIDSHGNGVDQLDDQLGHPVSGSSLAAEDNSTGYAGSAGITPEPVKKSDQVQDIQVLALVLVQPLHLYVEEGVRIHDDAGSLLDDVGQGTFVVGFYRSPVSLELDIVGQ